MSEEQHTLLHMDSEEVERLIKCQFPETDDDCRTVPLHQHSLYDGHRPTAPLLRWEAEGEPALEAASELSLMCHWKRTDILLASQKQSRWPCSMWLKLHRKLQEAHCLTLKPPQPHAVFNEHARLSHPVLVQLITKKKKEKKEIQIYSSKDLAGPWDKYLLHPHHKIYQQLSLSACLGQTS